MSGAAPIRGTDKGHKSGVGRKGLSACESCRLGKRKCDGIRPVCGTCSKRGPQAKCVFESRKARSTKTIEVLERRIAELEQERSYALSGHQDRQTRPPQTHMLSPDALLSPGEYASLLADSSTSLAGKQSYPSLFPSQVAESPVLEIMPDPHIMSGDRTDSIQNQCFLPGSDRDIRLSSVDIVVDGMGAVASHDTNPSQPEADHAVYFGKSSTINFVNQAQNILNTSNQTFLEWQLGEQDGLVTQHVRPRRATFEDYIVPPRREADAMLEVFWTRVYPLYPFVDRDEFDLAYSELWTSNPRPRDSNMCSSGNRIQEADDIPEARRFHVLLNAMFALGCHCDTSEPRERQMQRGDLFWQRCKQLLQLSFDIFNRPRLGFIQALLYMGVYLQSTTELTGACWNLVSVATRMAQALGLHCGHKSSARIPQETTSFTGKSASLRWQTWAGCVLMDRRLAITYGRPPMISAMAARIKIPTELSHRENENHWQAVLFLKHSLKLHELLIDIATCLYEGETDEGDFHDGLPVGSGVIKSFDVSPLANSMETGNFENIVRLESALLTWEKELPGTFRLPDTNRLRSGAEKPERLNRQAVVLRTQYLHAYILATRPLLLHHLRRGREDSMANNEHPSMKSILSKALSDRGPQLCIRAAMELVWLIDWVSESRSDMLPEPWYTIFYMYSCGMVLLIHKHCGPSDVDPSETWEKCLNVLNNYRASSRTAINCAKLLELSERSFSSSNISLGGAQDVLHKQQRHDGSEYRQRDTVSGAAAQSGSSLPDFSAEQRTQDHADELPSSWMDETIDLEWLSTLPFDLGVEELDGALW